jgi:hypothetical protein
MRTAHRVAAPASVARTPNTVTAYLKVLASIGIMGVSSYLTDALGLLGDGPHGFTK